MPRNFDRRVEVMFPVEAEDLRRRIVEEIIPAYLSDNRRARMLMPDGSYARAERRDGESVRSQTELLEHRDDHASPSRPPTPPATVAPATIVEAVTETNGAARARKEKEEGQVKDKKGSASPR